MFCNQRPCAKFPKPVPIWRWLVGQGLDDSIDLVVVAPVGKSEEFVLEGNEPGCLSGKNTRPFVNFSSWRDTRSTYLLLEDSDCREPGGFEILSQRSSEPGFFNQDGFRSVLFRLRNRLYLQVRIKKSISYDLKEVVVGFVNEQCGAGRTIVGRINFDGRIPALNDVM